MKNYAVLLFIIAILSAGCIGYQDVETSDPITTTETMAYEPVPVVSPTTQQTVEIVTEEPTAVPTPIESYAWDDQRNVIYSKNPYEATGLIAVEMLHCRQGIGTVEDCKKYGVLLDGYNGNVISINNTIYREYILWMNEREKLN